MRKKYSTIYPHVYEELNGASLQFQIWIIIDSNLTKTIRWDAMLLMEHENDEQHTYYVEDSNGFSSNFFSYFCT